MQENQNPTNNHNQNSIFKQETAGIFKQEQQDFEYNIDDIQDEPFQNNAS